MKLLRCYIENFGGLSQYSCTFGPGVTVIAEPNGFGKTTLAVFLRTMFYGFPARSGRSLEKNDRKKYLPWQGGVYGGYLEFEVDGTAYRVERRFGATPRQDTFDLYTLDPLQPSTRFGADLGTALFGLDADAFERSTYLPQSREALPLGTDSIRAKLGDLVEDTDDMGNFEQAISALRARRSAICPYRGSGGALGEDQEQISTLQSRIDETQALTAQLAAGQEKAAHLARELAEQDEQRKQLAGEITRAATAEARAERARQRAEIARELAETAAAEETLASRYPQGMPTQAETETAMEALDRLTALEAMSRSTEAETEAQALVERERARFAAGVPDGAALDTAREACAAYRDGQRRMAQLQADTAGNTRLAELESFFAPGVPDQTELDAMAAAQTARQKCLTQAAAEALPADQADRLAALETQFAAGVPTATAIDEQRQNLRRAALLRQGSPAKPCRSSGAISLGVGGILLLAVGIVLLVLGKTAIGGGAMGLGVVLLLGAIYVSLRQMVSGGTADAQREAAVLETGADRFAVSFGFADAGALDEMERLRDELQTLQSRARGARERAEALEAEARQQEAALSAHLGKWFPGSLPDGALAILTQRREELLRLRSQNAAAQADRQALAAEQDTRVEALTALLTPYVTQVDPSDFDRQLDTLRRDCDAYLAAKKLLEARDRRMAAARAEQARLEETLRGFFARCVELPHTRAGVQQIQRDAALCAQVAARRATLEKKQADLPPEAAEAEAAPTESAAVLRAREAALVEQQGQLQRELLGVEAQMRSLREQTDELPALRDELERWREKQAQDRGRSEILDKTMAFLTQAREELAGSFLGPVQKRFGAYLEQLLGDGAGRAFVNTDLEVQLERYGAARELGYFSAGSADLVRLCMRLALVDTLFEAEKPVLILDDPFVNLDDENTRRALSLLMELGRTHQILYLVCNSSRKP